jgi:2'-5' RNA ligase
MRLFIATTFPEGVLRTLNERLVGVKSRLPLASWVRPEAQHLTFAFLGEQDESVVARIAAPIERQLNQTAKFEAALHGSGFFPNRRRARVGWCGVEPEDRFASLAAAVREGVRAGGVAFEENEFRPHLTLMRIRDHWPPLAIETIEKAMRDYRSAPFTVDRATLFLSRLGPKGATHTPLREFALGLSP